MKTTFLYFPEMFENPAPAKIIIKKNQKYYEILTIYESNASKNNRWLLLVISEGFVWN